MTTASMNLNIAICDDEASWIDEAVRALEGYARDSDLSLSIETYASGADLLRTTNPAPDLLFCDIELNEEGKSGIDLVAEVSRRWPACQIVYVTNFLRYAPDVYTTNHLWFALKDQFEERLPEIFGKFARLREAKGALLAVTTVNKDLLSIPCEDILYLERRGRTTTIAMCDGSAAEVPDRLPDLLDRLPRRSFARCHGSFAVNLAHVRAVGKDAITLAGGASVPLSRRLARGFRDHYLDWVSDHAV